MFIKRIANLAKSNIKPWIILGSGSLVFSQGFQAQGITTLTNGSLTFMP